MFSIQIITSQTVRKYSNEFLNIGIRDIGTKDSNIIEDNKFPIPVRNDWSYDPKNSNGSNFLSPKNNTLTFTWQYSY